MAFLSDLTEGSVKGFLEGLGKSIKDGVSAFKADPTKLAELEATLTQAQLQYESLALQSVNATMQAEAKSEHWMQWAWRPTFGFTGAAVFFNNYVLLPYLKPFGIVPIEVPSEAWMVIMTILGVAAWTRGTEKVAKL